MEKNKWILGILIFILILQSVPMITIEKEIRKESGHIENFNNGQTSLLNNENIQQPRGRNADYLYSFIIICILIIIASIGYVTSSLINGTSINDMKINMKSNPLILFIVTLLTGLSNWFGRFYNFLGLFLFLILILTILIAFYYYNTSKNLIYFIISMCLIFTTGVSISNINKIKSFIPDNIKSNRKLIGLFFIISFVYIIIGIIYKLSFLVTLGLLCFIITMAIDSEYYIKLSNAFSGILLTILSLAMIGTSFSLIFKDANNSDFNSDKIIGFILLYGLILYFILFAIHFIYYHGFLLTKSMSFLKWFHLPIMDSAKLKKSPLYILCEGVFFEPFYKLGFLKNRIVIDNWHKTYNSSTKEIEDL